MASYDDELVAAFSRNERRIKRYLISRTRSQADSDDLAQEASFSTEKDMLIFRKLLKRRQSRF